MRILSPEEEMGLFEAIRTSPKAFHLEAIVTTALHSGMRKGEILNLRKDQVNFKEGYILVEGTKNGEIRKVPMTEIPT